MIRYALPVLVIGLSQVAIAQEQAEDKAMQLSVEQLRSAVGGWDVVTEFLNEDGSVARSVTGTYEFTWVVADRVLAGRSDIPELKQAAGILFYVNEAKRQIEMVSVGADGNLWIMTGPLGAEFRLSQEFETPKGATARLRFTRFNVLSDMFESRMEYTDDGGKTWKPGNRQVFRRKAHRAP